MKHIKVIRLAVIIVLGLIAIGILLIEKNMSEIVGNDCEKGMACLQNRQYTQAIELFNKALAIKPNYKPAYAGLGLVYEEMGKVKEALKYYKKTLSVR